MKNIFSDVSKFVGDIFKFIFINITELIANDKILKIKFFI